MRSATETQSHGVFQHAAFQCLRGIAPVGVLVLARPRNGVDHQHIDGAPSRFQRESELLLQKVGMGVWADSVTASMATKATNDHSHL